MQQVEPDVWKQFEAENNKPKVELSDLKIKQVKYSNHKPFWDKFLSEPYPEGDINRVLEKNFAIWSYLNDADLEQIKARYIAQGWDPKPFLGWRKSILEGKLKEYNSGEIYLWCIKYRRQDLADLISDQVDAGQLETDIKVLSDSELENYTAKATNWLIEPMIKSGGIVVLGGKRSTLKSWFCLNMSYCVAQGLDFLGKFKTDKSPVLYLDRENQFSELKIRSRLTKKGLDITGADVHFLSESYVKIDSPSDINKIEQIIKERKIKLFIVDVYRRVISFDENDAREVSKLFIDLLKPLCERTGISIILIHHEKKGESSGDDMDMLRGSSDLANYVDGILQLERKGDLLTVKQSKNRAGKELEPFQVKVLTDETGYFKFEYKGGVETTSTFIAKVIIQWIQELSIQEFTYSKVMSYCENKGYKKNSIVTALSDLQNKGIITKGDSSRSPYTVSKGLNIGGYNG